MFQVPVRVLRLFVDRAFTHTGTHLRGSVLHQFPDREPLHNRRSDGIARLPDVRFVVRRRVPHIVAVGPGREEALDLYKNIQKVTVPDGEYRVTQAELLDQPVKVGPIQALKRYCSETHWLGLNQRNHQQYSASRSRKDRREMLERILIGNFLVSLRHLGVELQPDQRVLVSVDEWSEQTIRVRDVSMLGLKLKFSANLAWSPWLGVGKQVAKGFGLLTENRR